MRGSLTFVAKARRLERGAANLHRLLRECFRHSDSSCLIRSEPLIATPSQDSGNTTGDTSTKPIVFPGSLCFGTFHGETLPLYKICWFVVDHKARLLVKNTTRGGLVANVVFLHVL